MPGAIVGIMVEDMECCSVPGTAKVCSEVGEREILELRGIPTNVPSSLGAGIAGEVAPRLLGAGWVLPGAGAGVMGLGMLFELSGGWVVDCCKTAGT